MDPNGFKEFSIKFILLEHLSHVDFNGSHTKPTKGKSTYSKTKRNRKIKQKELLEIYFCVCRGLHELWNAPEALVVRLVIHFFSKQQDTSLNPLLA